MGGHENGTAGWTNVVVKRRSGLIRSRGQPRPTPRRRLGDRHRSARRRRSPPRLQRRTGHQLPPHLRRNHRPALDHRQRRTPASRRRQGVAAGARWPSSASVSARVWGPRDLDSRTSADRDRELGEVRDERRPAAPRSHRRGSGSVQRLPEPGRPDDRRQSSGPGAPPPAHLPRPPQQPQHRTPTSLGDREYSSHRSGRCSREDAGSRRRDRSLAGGQAGAVRRRSGRRPCSRSSWPAPRSCCRSVT